jgi:glycosyltransferase involved in cell wall biosynthesis
MSRKRALVCSYHVPQPNRDSGSRRLFDFIRFFREAGWDVVFLAADGIGDERDARVLRQRGVPVYDGSKIDLQGLFAAARFDLALLAFWVTAERYIPTIREVSPQTRILIDSVDLHFMREARRVFQAARSSSAVGCLDPGQSWRMAREINAYAAADGVLAVSVKETELINDFAGDAHLACTVPDGEELHPSPLAFVERRGVLFVGSFQHQPNINAVEYLCKEVLPHLDPAVAAEHPVYVVGNALSDTVRSLARDLPHVRMVGWVPSVEPYFAQARISVVPLLYGAGTKRKLIQALLSGTPTVSTPVGIEGLNLQSGEHVLVADSAADFAACMSKLLADEELWTRLAQQGRALVAQTHNLERARRLFHESVEAVLARAPKGPPPPVQMLREGASRHWDPLSYRQLANQVREIVRGAVPPDATVAVISKGDPELIKLDERRGWHFPQGEDGGYSGYYPPDGTAAVVHLEAVRARGAEYLVIPGVALWWLDSYPEFRQHLESRFQEVARRDGVCVVYSLHAPANGSEATALVRGAGNSHDGQMVTTSAPARSSENGVAWSGAPLLSGAALHGGSAICQDLATPDDKTPKLIAFYLPQFHPIPENDAWWGEGFTEWRNVVKADPLFPGHYQPHLPADMGYYDLRCPETREEQAILARAHGIHGFCYYHYWFEGKRLLERPFNEILASGKPDFPFCLCWANDPWSRRWDGRTQDLLQPQTYSRDDDLAHIRWLLPALSDPRAIQADGRPVFLVYRVKELPDARRTTDTWRQEVARAGLKGIYLLAMETAWDLGWDATAVGFDAKVLFQPQFGRLLTSARRLTVPGRESLQVYDYRETWRVLGEPPPVPYTRFDTVCPGWDNTARVAANAVVLHNSTPAEYASWLSHALAKAQQRPSEPRFVFINAWNEWAEGCHLEPDTRHGLAYLEATKNALMYRAGHALLHGQSFPFCMLQRT